MTPERWARIKEVFGEALEKPEAERGTYLDSACGGDAELRGEVEKLLAGSEAASLRSPAADLLNQAVAELAPGEMLAHYRVEAKLGQGGMGVVYRANDTSLRRQVALKVLPPELHADPDGRRRLVREARAASALNHPNIVTVHEIGSDRGVDFISMEYVEGRSLAQLIPAKGLRVKRALEYAIAIADGLAQAHAAGIVHRDLKPGNVMVTGEGRVKVLDFGLAKLTEAAAVSPEDPTLTWKPSTEAGLIVGTVSYMSPEQAEGKKVDARSDIFSFGSLLYEMLTGQRPFRRDTPVLTLAAILHMEPLPLPPEIPRELERVVARCLRKEPSRRIQHMDDVKLALEEVRDAPETPLLEGAPGAGIARRRWLGWGVAAALAAGLALVAFLHFRGKSPAPAAPLHFQIQAPENAVACCLSPDGRKVVFITRDRLWVHFLETGESRDLTAADGGVPFWSPDSRFLGYVSQGKLKRIEATGGPPQTVTDLRSGYPWGGGAWNQDDVIVFADLQAGLFRVPASGGVPVQITALDPARQETAQFCPSFLPDGRHFVYVRSSPDKGKSAIYLGSVDAKPEQQSSKALVASNSQPVYAPSADPSTGYLLFVRGGTLMAQPFDNRRLEMKGQAAPVAEQVSDDIAGAIAVDFSASANDVLLFSRSPANRQQLTWFDREGKVMGTVGEPGAYANGMLTLSPDGTQVALWNSGQRSDAGTIWMLDLSRGGASTRVTFSSRRDTNAVWSPDGRRIIFSSNRDGPHNLFQKPANSVKAEQVLLKSSENKFASSWSRDGRFLLYTVVYPKGKMNIWVLPLEGGRKPAPFLITEFTERQARFSPDGKWVAYTSNESGQDEVYVRSFSMNSTGTAVEAGGKWPISNGRGFDPRWRGDGRELYYRADYRRLMAVEIATHPVFRAGNPKPLGSLTFTMGWDSAADGRRFLGLATTSEAPPSYTVVLNWQAGLKK